MLVEFPLWVLILITCGSCIISFLIFKMIGFKLLYSIALSFIIPVAFVMIFHTFDVVDGKIIPHVGDFFVGIFLIVALAYWILLSLYAVIYHIIRTFCCDNTDKNLDKIKAAYGPENDVNEPLFGTPELPAPPPLSDLQFIMPESPDIPTVPTVPPETSTVPAVPTVPIDIKVVKDTEPGEV